MNLKEELLKSAVMEILFEEIKSVKIDVDDIVDTLATDMIKEIQNVLKSGKSDFETVEEIVCIFEKHNIDAGSCHDFA